jgi:hypothetical protein
VDSVDVFDHIGSFPCQRELVLPHLGDSPKYIVTWMEVRLHKVGASIVGLPLLPALSGDLGGDLFV